MMKKFAIIFGLSLLTACGFEPVHKNTSNNGLSPYPNLKVIVQEGPTPDTQNLAYNIRQAIIDRIGDGNGLQTLDITPTVFQIPLGISGDDIASRFEIRASASYRLTDVKSGDVWDKGRVSTIASFGASLDPFGRLSAENAAMERLAKELSDDIILKISEAYTRGGPVIIEPELDSSKLNESEISDDEIGDIIQIPSKDQGE